MNYIISLKHTGLKDKYITLWRPNNSGYTLAMCSAGEYPNPEKGYHDNESNMPISIRSANAVSIIDGFDGEKGVRMIPNTKAVWNAFNRPDIAKQFKK